MTEDIQNEVICSNCMTGNPELSHFCKSCGNPLDAYSTIAPFERIKALGWFFRKASDGKPKRMVFWGMWIL